MAEPLQLEEATTPLKLTSDKRPRMPEPLPVRLVSVEHVRLPAPAGVEVKLDELYVALLEFQRLEGELAYRADNFTLRFDVLEPPIAHDSLRPQQIEVLSLADTEKKLIEAEIEYARQRGLTPGEETLLLLDPAGNWIEITERRIVQ
jgi:hypothetical protein